MDALMNEPFLLNLITQERHYSLLDIKATREAPRYKTHKFMQMTPNGLNSEDRAV